MFERFYGATYCKFDIHFLHVMLLIIVTSLDIGYTCDVMTLLCIFSISVIYLVFEKIKIQKS